MRWRRREQPVEGAASRGFRRCVAFRRRRWLTSGDEFWRVCDDWRIQSVQQRVDTLRHTLHHQVARRLHRVADQIETREPRLWNHVLALPRAVDRPFAAILAHRQDVDTPPERIAKKIA